MCVTYKTIRQDRFMCTSMYLFTLAYFMKQQCNIIAGIPGARVPGDVCSDSTRAEGREVYHYTQSLPDSVEFSSRSSLVCEGSCFYITL